MTAPLTIAIDLTALYARLDVLEARLMTTQAEAFAALSAKIDDIKADFTALLTQLAAERENLTEAGQAALDEAVGDADGSDAVAPE